MFWGAANGSPFLLSCIRKEGPADISMAHGKISDRKRSPDLYTDSRSSVFI